MHPVTPPPVPPRRRVWPWVVGILLTPFVVLGLAVASYVTLDSDAAALRRQVMRATNADWNTKIQLSIGRGTLGTVSTGLLFVDHADIKDARLALRAVRDASVGVYELAAGEVAMSREELFVQTDRMMQKRGWTRLVGVSQPREAVLVYVSEDLDDEDDPIDVCVAVVNRREMVVVSATVDPDMVAQLVERHAGEEIRREVSRSVRVRF